MTAAQPLPAPPAGPPRWHQALWPLLAPWPALLAGGLLLRGAEAWTLLAAGHADAAVSGLEGGAHALLLAMLRSDAQALAWALPLWCLLLAPVTRLPPHWQLRVLGLASALLLLALALLNLYFVVAGVPLGADLLAYSWAEIRTTVAGARPDLPGPWLAALLLALGLLAWWLRRLRQWRELQVSPGHGPVVGRPAPVTPPAPAVTAIMPLAARPVLLLWTLATLGLLLWPAGPAQPQAASNKLVFWLGDVLAGQGTAATAARADLGAYPFEHEERTPDTLGPLLALDPQTPPHLLFVIVEGLGRSFSGPDARLGSFTPFLDTLAQQSLYWTNFVAPQGRTFAVLHSLFGSLPFGPWGSRPVPHDNLLNLLQARGYALRYFTGTDLAFDQQGAFLAASGLTQTFSERDYAPPAQRTGEWGYADADLVDAVLASMPPAGPSLTVVQTMSMHSPFRFAGLQDYRERARARLGALGVPAERRAVYEQQLDLYASMLYTDAALRRLVEGLSQRPAWRNTVLFITGDHRLPEIAMASPLERYHVPLIVHSPLLRAPQQIRALSSHFDVAPAVLALLAQRYGWQTPQRVHWMGAGLDTHPHWRNLHTLPLKQTRSTLVDYIAGDYALAQGRLYTLQDGLQLAPEAQPALAQDLQQALARVRAQLAVAEQAGRLVAPRQPVPTVAYDAAQRQLQSGHRAPRLRGVVVTQTEARLQPDGTVQAQALFALQGEQASPVFVPLLVLTDAQGRELAEASGPALRLQPGQTQTLQLALPPAQRPPGALFVAMVVSHPDTGKPIGKGQYHVPLAR